MQHSLNVIGQNVAKFRRQRGWTHEELAAKLQLLGCNITPQIIANIETRHCSMADAQIVCFMKVLRIPLSELKPSVPRASIVRLARAVKVERPFTPRLHLDCTRFAGRDGA